MLLKLVPDVTHIKFMAYKKIAAILSAIAIVVSIFAVVTMGLNFGIDFKGGTLIEIKTPEPVEVASVRTLLNDIDVGEVVVQEFGEPRDLLVQIGGAKSESGETTQSVVELATQTIQQAIPGTEIRRVEVVGPKVSSELFTEGLLALGLALLAILIYIWLRFEWQFAVSAIVALFHDIIITIGIFALFQLEFNLSIVAALLTIIGYSLNDTVIVFDRVRENLRRYKVTPLPEVLNLSLNETLSRTAMTSLTTLLALFILYTFGGEAVSGFTFALIWGIFVGTHSSVFIACPLLMTIGIDRAAMATDTEIINTPATKGEKL